MKTRTSSRIKFMVKLALIVLAFSLAACSHDNNPVDAGGTSKVAGRITTANGMPKTMAKSGSVTSSQGGIQGAAVILAQVQADGSLKTVSTQTVQTDANGRFTAEANVSGVRNLIVVATQGTTQWKAVVSSTVQSGTTVYAPPLSAESTTEADLFIRLVGQGMSSDVDESDLKILVSNEAAMHIGGNANMEAQFLTAMQAGYQAMVQASQNSYFGFTAAQFQAMMSAKEDAVAKLDAAMYMSGDTEEETDNDMNDCEGTVLSTYASQNINVSAYAKLMRIGLTAFVNSTSSMDAQTRLAIVRSFYKRYSFVLNFSMKQQFQAAGASDAQISAVASAGAALYGSIKSSTNLTQISDAFVQYHSSVESQLKVTLSSYATQIDTIDTSINSGGGAKDVFSAALNISTSFDTVINAYVTFFTAVKTAVQATLVGASSIQVSAATQILILANMN
ncbi:MAG: carboxypeptidase-like regulatory domain-containing protein [Bacteroidota bacterium]